MVLGRIAADITGQPVHHPQSEPGSAGISFELYAVINTITRRKYEIFFRKGMARFMSVHNYHGVD